MTKTVYEFRGGEYVMLPPISPMSCRGCEFIDMPTGESLDCKENDYMMRYEGAPDCQMADLVYVRNDQACINEHHYQRAMKRLGQPVTIHDLREIAKHDE